VSQFAKCPVRAGLVRAHQPTKAGNIRVQYGRELPFP